MKWYEVLSLVVMGVPVIILIWAWESGRVKGFINLVFQNELNKSKLKLGELPTANKEDFSDEENLEMAKRGDSPRSPYIIETDDPRYDWPD
ncbi:MAG: hypothetical protein A2493_02685 [Candidatus Magasanikbacteria bacterium RIFOXYC12_FULL_33_11]|uniref:Uncharacterized protein n=1 Tax=Candidatus Magasanikbacteria bacterium RIFOXYC12_FULL_33_11 TaxID=1798701 RepID=A0A1F6NRF1_9BACT|nr:MAG: hypothetical protein A2493_02685 [Candidatus Magasanikbacteria bacterium RIFOXYC12_FULL_33_11]